jgi:hypothetical protein
MQRMVQSTVGMPVTSPLLYGPLANAISRTSAGRKVPSDVSKSAAIAPEGVRATLDLTAVQRCRAAKSCTPRKLQCPSRGQRGSPVRLID